MLLPLSTLILEVLLLDVLDILLLEVLFASSDGHKLYTNGYMGSCAAQERAYISNLFRVWAPRGEDTGPCTSHAQAMHTLVRDRTRVP